jgi:hypothetical protein
MAMTKVANDCVGGRADESLIIRIMTKLLAFGKSAA